MQACVYQWRVHPLDWLRNDRWVGKQVARWVLVRVGLDVEYCRICKSALSVSCLQATLDDAGKGLRSPLPDPAGKSLFISVSQLARRPISCLH
jgi:hypothetical protein